MATLVVGSEKNLKDLRARLFDGKVSAAVAKRVGAAIADANPHLDIDALAPGTVLEIPDLPDIAVGEALAGDPLHADVGASAEELRASFDALREDAKAADRTERAQRKLALAALDTDEVTKLAAGDPELAARIDEARDGLKAADAAAKARTKELDELIAAWTAELDAPAGPVG